MRARDVEPARDFQNVPSRFVERFAYVLGLNVRIASYLTKGSKPHPARVALDQQ